MAGMVEIVFQSGLFWLSFIFMPIISLTPDVIVKSLMVDRFTPFTDIRRLCWGKNSRKQRNSSGSSSEIIGLTGPS